MKKIKNIALGVLLLSGFSSCLKDNTIISPDAPGAVKHIVEFLNPVPPVSGTQDSIPLYVVSYDVSPAAELEVKVSYSGGGGAPGDIHVKVAIDNAALLTVNRAQGLDLSPIPQSVYTVNTLDVLIPNGQKTGSIIFSLKPDKFDFGYSYGIGLKIVSVTGTNAPISGNFGTIVINVGAKNKLDGLYKVTGTMVDYTSASLTGLYPATYELITQSASSVAMFDPTYFGNYIHLIRSGANVSGYGSFSPQFFFDNAGNITKVENAYGQPAGNGRSAKMDPTGVNKIDANGNFKVKYFMLQPGTTIRTTFDETFTRIGAR